MPSPERGPAGPPPEDQAPKEQEPAPYYRAARFPSERPAGRAYDRLQEAIFGRSDADLSAFRFQLNRIYHVAVLGQSPPEDFDRRLQRILSSGEPVSLPYDVLARLHERRRQATQFGPWIEGHYRPG